MEKQEIKLGKPDNTKMVNQPSDVQNISHKKSYFSIERPVPPVYSTIDTDLARDNLENDIPAADLQDL